ncbi:hypothetical protein C8R47DRAFT_1326991 [Mycena vitilis]|nr:hypothetical protein C8R47DRAFT_1326991 [Mycena vitilis]
MSATQSLSILTSIPLLPSSFPSSLHPHFHPPSILTSILSLHFLLAVIAFLALAAVPPRRRRTPQDLKCPQDLKLPRCLKPSHRLRIIFSPSLLPPSPSLLAARHHRPALLAVASRRSRRRLHPPRRRRRRRRPPHLTLTFLELAVYEFVSPFAHCVSHPNPTSLSSPFTSSSPLPLSPILVAAPILAAVHRPPRLPSSTSPSSWSLHRHLRPHLSRRRPRRCCSPSTNPSQDQVLIKASSPQRSSTPEALPYLVPQFSFTDLPDLSGRLFKISSCFKVQDLKTLQSQHSQEPQHFQVHKVCILVLLLHPPRSLLAFTSPLPILLLAALAVRLTAFCRPRSFCLRLCLCCSTVFALPKFQDLGGILIKTSRQLRPSNIKTPQEPKTSRHINLQELKLPQRSQAFKTSKHFKASILKTSVGHLQDLKSLKAQEPDQVYRPMDVWKTLGGILSSLKASRRLKTSRPGSRLPAIGCVQDLRWDTGKSQGFKTPQDLLKTRIKFTGQWMCGRP